VKVDPDAAGFDGTRLERITDHIQQRYLVPEKIAGCQVAVARRGAVAYFRNFGSMDLERGKPTADDTIWRIYSMTKPITGVALMSLYEKGHFQLSDPVHRFIPEWKDLKVREVDASGASRLVEPRRPMSVRDLLMHMSGLGFGGARPEPEAASVPAEGGGLDLLATLTAGREGTTLETMCSRLAERPLRFHPGTQWLYTISTDICGRLVEVMSGRRFDEYLQSEIFDPLGMSDTGFTVPDDKVDRFAALYRRGPKKTLVLADDPERSSYRKEKSFFSGGGGLVSTIDDYLRFAQMMTGGGEIDGIRILSRKTIELMATNHLPGGADLRQFAMPGGYGEVGFDGMGFGLTMAVNQGPAESQSIGNAGDFSWGGAASTIFWCDPTDDITAVFMTQLLPSGTFNFRGQLKSLVYGALAD
jgi:CubicO group peptidase (beta-lactamase class C family)